MKKSVSKSVEDDPELQAQKRLDPAAAWNDAGPNCWGTLRDSGIKQARCVCRYFQWQSTELRYCGH